MAEIETETPETLETQDIDIDDHDHFHSDKALVEALELEKQCVVEKKPVRSPREESPHSHDHGLASILGPGNYKPLARKAGLSAVHVSKALRGKVGLTLDAAARIADAAEVSIDDLLYYIDGQIEG